MKGKINMRKSLSTALCHAAKQFKDCSYKYHDIGSRRKLEGRQAWKDLIRAEESLFRAVEALEDA